MDGEEIRRQLAEARTNRERVFGELSNLRAREQAEGPSDGISERVANLNRGVAAADDRILELEAELGRTYDREAYVRQIVADPAHRLDTEAPAPELREGRGDRNEQRDAALRAIDRNADRFLDSDSAERVEQVVRKPEPNNLTNRYLAAVADPDYASAFAKMAADPGAAA